MEQLYLMYFLPADTDFSTVYNPSDIPSFRADVNSEAGRILKAKPNDVVLIKRVGVGQFEIIRRAKYPMSHNQFLALVSDENGTGGEGARQTVFIGENELFKAGGAGLFNRQSLPIWLLLALAFFVIIND